LPTITLTDISLRALKPPATGQIVYYDKSLPGFGIRISQGGSRTWILVDSRSKRRTKLKIGRYPLLSLSQAREEARKRLASVTLGQKAKPASLPFEDAVAAFLAAHAGRDRTKADLTRLLGKHFTPKFRGTHLSEITAQDITKILDRLKDTPSEQNHAYAAAKTFFNWAESREYIERTPMAKLSMPAVIRSRERVLRPEELKAVWLACSGIFGKIVRLLILTGQRKGEIGALHGSYVNRLEKLITLPGSLTKNGRDHTFPYSDLAEQHLPELEQYLFPARVELFNGKPTTCFNGWSKAKTDLDKASGVTNWTLHDLRRTFATGLSDLGIEPHIVERLINHISGEISGVAAIYNRARYLVPMRQAVDKWAQYISTLTGTSTGS
jgi:integrase